MPDDTTPTDDETSGAPVVHDDIMKRLLDYQRQLRESPLAEEDVEAPGRMVDYASMEAQATATATVTEQVVDLTEVEEEESANEVEEEESADEVEVIEVLEAAPISAVDETEPDKKKAEAEAEAMRRRAAEEAAAETLEQPSVEAAELEVPKAKAAEPMSASEEDLAARVAQLEAALERIGMMLTAVRSEFQDLAIRADERIAEIESALTAARGSVPGAE